PGIERHVALKIIRKELIGQERTAEVTARFKKEAQAGGGLMHPGVGAVDGCGGGEKTAFIAVGFGGGRGGRQYLPLKGGFGLGETMNIMAQLLDALDYAHEHGIVHRDVKPANVLLTDEKKVKVADFGIARLENSMLTQVGAVMGTPNYMSPEQFAGATADRRS